MAVGVLVAGILLAGPAGAVKETDSIRDARDKREAAKGLAAEAAEALVLIEAADDEVSDALHALDDAVALQEAKILAARQAIEAAEAEATLRWVQADEITTEVADLRRRIQELAVDVYIGRIRPGSLLESADLTAGVRRAAILDAVTGDRGDLVDAGVDIAGQAQFRLVVLFDPVVRLVAVAEVERLVLAAQVGQIPGHPDHLAGVGDPGHMLIGAPPARDTRDEIVIRGSPGDHRQAQGAQVASAGR